MYICIDVYMYICIYVCIYVYIYVYVFFLFEGNIRVFLGGDRRVSFFYGAQGHVKIIVVFLLFEIT